MDKALLSKIEHHINEQLKTAVEDIIASVMEDVLEVSDYDTHYDVAYDTLDTYGGDVEELAANAAHTVMEAFQKHLENVTAIALETFTHTALPSIKEAHEQGGGVDITARREGWSNWVDYLNKSGRISDYEAANIDADVDSL